LLHTKFENSFKDDSCVSSILEPIQAVESEHSILSRDLSPGPLKQPYFRTIYLCPPCYAPVHLS